MSAINALQTVKELISYAVVTDKNSLVKLLQRNGIQVPNNPSDNEVTVAVLLANQKSGVFRNELKNYLSTLLPDVQQNLSFLGGNKNFTGIDDYSFNSDQYGYKNVIAEELVPEVIDSTSTSIASSTSTTGDTGAGFGSTLSQIGKWLGDNVLTKQNINTGIQIGLNSLANQGAQKQNQLQQQAIQLQKGQDQLKQKLPATKTGSNTMLYVWIGVGVLTVTILGVILYKQNKK